MKSKGHRRQMKELLMAKAQTSMSSYGKNDWIKKKKMGRKISSADSKEFM